VVTTLLDVPILFVLSLRTIIKIGHCYGYALAGNSGQQYALGVLVAAVSGTQETRQARLDRLRDVEDLLIEETEEELAAEELTSFLFQLEIFDEIPGLGAISGSVLNLAFVHRVELTARRVFQERWLRDAGKITVIDPSPVHPLHLIPGWSGVLHRATHAAAYSIGFGATVPIHLASVMLRPVKTAVRSGNNSEPSPAHEPPATTGEGLFAESSSCDRSREEPIARQKPQCRVRPACHQSVDLLRAAMNEARISTGVFSAPKLGMIQVRTPG
jgi:EcsC protein family